MSIIREEISKPLIVNTGKFTGRSPKDRYFVKTDQYVNKIDWGHRNQPISEKNFDIVKLENLSFDEQIYIFSNAKIVIGAHGAGLTNLCFSKEK